MLRRVIGITVMVFFLASILTTGANAQPGGGTSVAPVPNSDIVILGLMTNATGSECITVVNVNQSLGSNLTQLEASGCDSYGSYSTEVWLYWGRMTQLPNGTIKDKIGFAFSGDATNFDNYTWTIVAPPTAEPICKAAGLQSGGSGTDYQTSTGCSLKIPYFAVGFGVSPCLSAGASAGWNNESCKEACYESASQGLGSGTFFEFTGNYSKGFADVGAVFQITSSNVQTTTETSTLPTTTTLTTTSVSTTTTTSPTTTTATSSTTLTIASSQSQKVILAYKYTGDPNNLLFIGVVDVLMFLAYICLEMILRLQKRKAEAASYALDGIVLTLLLIVFEQVATAWPYDFRWFGWQGFAIWVLPLALALFTFRHRLPKRPQSIDKHPAGDGPNEETQESSKAKEAEDVSRKKPENHEGDEPPSGVA